MEFLVHTVLPQIQRVEPVAIVAISTIQVLMVLVEQSIQLELRHVAKVSGRKYKPEPEQ